MAATIVIACTGCAALAGQSGAGTSASVSKASSAAQEAGTPCSVTVAAQISPSDDPMGRIVPGFPPARVPGPGVQPMTLAEAEQAARNMRGAYASDGSGPAPSDAPISATDEAYIDWAQNDGMPANNLINPSRCVWVVTVQATFVPDGPPGVTLPAHHVYTVIIDVGSHFLIGFKSPHP